MVLFKTFLTFVPFFNFVIFLISDICDYRYYDKEMEEVYLRARYYQPAVGRFLTRDTYTGEADEPLSLQIFVPLSASEKSLTNIWYSPFSVVSFKTPSSNKTISPFCFRIMFSFGIPRLEDLFMPRILKKLLEK